MRRLTNSTIALLAGGAALLAASPGLARADAAYTIELSAPSSGTVGEPLVIQASGVNPPPSELGTASWIEAAAIPAGVVSECPLDGQSAIQIATSGAGRLLAIAMRPNLDAEGRFTNSLGWVPLAAGQWFVCAYQDDGAGLTLARATASVQVVAAPASAPSPPPAPAPPTPAGNQPGPGQASVARPVNLARPRAVRSGSRIACRPGRWSNVTAGYSYSWLVNGRTKRDATRPALRVTRALRGSRVQCEVTAADPAGSASALSRPLRIG